jgi:glycosyltransferase involved in cell wall biosynthesis
VSVPCTYPWPAKRNWSAARHSFLWFGSGGMVHKGLDLVLETFAGLPDLELFVCGPVDRERDFERFYRRELYELDNIHTLGWVDVSGRLFLGLAERCAALVYPSCSEGGGSSALTCMHAGLIPMLTREASVDLSPERTVELVDLDIDALRQTVRDLSERPAEDLEQLARAGWIWAGAHHSRARFEAAYREFLRGL